MPVDRDGDRGDRATCRRSCRPTRRTQPEHALEVELPFLQTVLGDFALVPLVVGDATPEEVAEVLDRLWGGPETLLVISSDLSHYEAYAARQAHDAATAAAIERLDGAALGPRDACGHLPIARPADRGAAARPARPSASTCATRATPPDPRTRWSATAPGRFTRLERSSPMPVRLFAGASGFSYKPWKGPFYPADLPDAEMLGYYAERLPAVEINNTFYRLPKAQVLEDWAAQTPDGFRFVPQGLAPDHPHPAPEGRGRARRATCSRPPARSARSSGRCLFQLPPHLKKDLDRLRAFLDLVPADRQVALEFRNASWFEDDVFEALRAHDAALCVAETEPDDKEGASEPVPLVATASWGYLRLRRDDYTDADLAAWADADPRPGLVGGLCLLQARGRGRGAEARAPADGAGRADGGPVAGFRWLTGSPSSGNPSATKIASVAALTFRSGRSATGLASAARSVADRESHHDE